MRGLWGAMLSFGLLVACGPTAPDGEGGGSGMPDAGATADASRGGGSADAATPADAEYGPHKIAESCRQGVPGLILWVAEAYQSGSCEPFEEVESFEVYLEPVEVEQSQAGESFEFGGATVGFICPADPNENCEIVYDGNLIFESYEAGSGATGIINMRGGEIQEPFDAVWCDAGRACN